MIQPPAERGCRGARLAARLLTFAGLLALGGCAGGGASTPGAGGFPPPEVTVVTVAPRTVPVPFELTGRVEGSREVEVRARVGGILLARRYQEGRPVAAGATLFVIDPAPYQAAVAEAKAQLAEAQARQARTEREAKRLEPMNPEPSLILLTGATGYIGGRLLRLLEKQGYRVRGLARRPALSNVAQAPSTDHRRDDQ